MSWGGGAYSQALHDALTYAYNSGVVLVAAAGNSSKDNDTSEMYPANFPIPSQLTVGAVNDFDSLATFSNFGKNRVQISAPGVSVYSTAVGGYRILSGTSMAAPFVSGLAAMVMSEKPELSGYQVRNLLLNSADSLGSLIEKIQQGSRAQALKTIINVKMDIQAQGFQPPYQPVRPSVNVRSPASQEVAPTQMGGCGMVSTSLMSRWLFSGPNGSGATEPSVVWLVALSLLPLMVWQGLRIRSKIVSYMLRRRHERFIMNSEIKVKVGDRELVGQMNTISAGGVSFKADTLLEKGGTVTLLISSPDGQENLEVQGRIVWSEENQSYGVQFTEEKSEIKNWSKYLSKAS
jgi:Tfp pilus assembly protein PilZ